MTSHRSSFTLQPEAHAFLQKVAPDNRSAYINELLLKEKQQFMADWFARANKEEAADLEYLQECREWDTVLADGLDDEEA